MRAGQKTSTGKAQPTSKKRSKEKARPGAGSKIGSEKQSGSLGSWQLPPALFKECRGSPNTIESNILGQIFSQMNEAILILDKELRVSYANDAFYQQVSVSAQDLVGKPITWLGQPPIAGMPRDPAAFEEWMRHKTYVSGEAALPTMAGTTIPSYITMAPVMDSQGDIVAYVSTHLDLRQVRQVQAKLRESEEKFRAISTAAQDAIIVLDDRGSIVFWNEAATRIFGFSEQEALGQNAHVFLAPARYRHSYTAAWRRFAKDGHSTAIGTVLELEAERKDGTELPVEISVASAQIKGHWHAAGIVRDITERKQSERQLRLFRDLIDNSNDAVEVIDPETLRFLDVNDKSCRDLGYGREELMSMTVPDIDPTFGRATMDMIDEQVLKSGAAVFERLHRRKDGSSFPVEIGLRFIDIGKQTYVLSIARDITERKQAEEALQRTNRALRTISACNMTLVHAKDEQHLLDEMCRTVVEQGGYHLAWIGFVEQDESKSIRQVAIAGCQTDCAVLPRTSWGDNKWGQNPAGRAVRLGLVQTAKDILTDPQHAAWRQEALDCGYASCVALPLKNDENDTFGVFNICSADPSDFDDDEIQLLQEFASDLSFGVLTLRIRGQRDHYQRENLKNLGRLNDTFFGTIRALANMVEQRDPYTAGHQNRVADLSCAIATELGFDTDRIDGLRLGAMIHDIGKISIPAEVLNRPGKLSDLEFELIKTHAQAGYDIIKDVDFPWPVANMVRQHHERLDGSGYPQGLKGDEICLEARIIGVADVVDAVSAHRPYRPARGIEKALEIIKAERGETMDSEAVDACLRLFLEKGYSLGDR